MKALAGAERALTALGDVAERAPACASRQANSRDWSARGGLTQNPFALGRTAGGSSSGSAALVAADVVDLAIGTETDLVKRRLRSYADLVR